MNVDNGEAIRVIEAQLKELDAIYRQAADDLNTVRGTERVRQWKVRTTPLLAQHVGAEEGKRFGALHPGTSFTADLLEELSDEVELYRAHVAAVLAKLRNAG
jgi:hypothetical protein